MGCYEMKMIFEATRITCLLPRIAMKFITNEPHSPPLAYLPRKGFPQKAAFLGKR